MYVCMEGGGKQSCAVKIFIPLFVCIANVLKSKSNKENNISRMEFFTCCWNNFPLDFPEAHKM